MLVTLGNDGRIWAVPAIFGHAEPLRRLHAALAEKLAPGDKLVYLGNYMGHGAQIVATVNELLSFRARLLAGEGRRESDIVHLRGAQEEMWVKLLQIQWAMRPEETFAWLMAHGAQATLKAYGGDPSEAPAKFRAGVLVTARWTTELREAFQAHPGHYDFLHGLASAAATGDDGLLLVSAGLNPHKPLSQQNDLFWWGYPAFENMQAPFEGFSLVVRGFDRERKGIHIGEYTASIDGGCGFGGRLVAVCFDPAGGVLDTLEA